jgi:hypothetical protein
MSHDFFIIIIDKYLSVDKKKKKSMTRICLARFYVSGINICHIYIISDKYMSRFFYVSVINICVVFLFYNYRLQI